MSILGFRVKGFEHSISKFLKGFQSPISKFEKGFQSSIFYFFAKKWENSVQNHVFSLKFQNHVFSLKFLESHFFFARNSKNNFVLGFHGETALKSFQNIKSGLSSTYFCSDKKVKILRP